MITKKLGKITFGWDPTANKGKGYWYVAGKDDSFSRAASQSEASKLGKPKASDGPKKDAPEHKYYWTTNPKTGKPMRKKLRTGSDYEESDITRSKGLGQLASERMMNGEGIGASLKGALKDKIGARGIAIKKTFDPMNMLSKLPGGLGTMAATAWGKKRGRDPKDISYFTGIHAPDKEAVPDKEESTTASKIGGKGSGGMGKGAVGVLREIKQTIVDKFEEDKKQKEIDKNFDEQKKAEEDKKHKEIIEALQGIHGENKPEKKEKEKSGFLSMLSSMFGDLLGNIMGGPKRLLSKAGGLIKRAGSGLISGAKSLVRGSKNIAMKAGSGIKSGFSAIKSGLGFGSKAASTASTGLDVTKSTLTQAKPGTAIKVAETAEKAGASLAKAGGTASKVAGAGSKLLKGGGKLLGFLKSVPGLGAIAAGADLIMRVQELNGKVASGEVKDSEYKKEMTKVIGDAMAAGLLPILGGAIGSVVPGVGTLVGGLAGGAAALMGGDKIGGYVAGKMYDFFVDDKKGGEDKSASPETKSTASAIPSSPSSSATSTQSNPTTQAKGWEAGPNSKQYRENTASLQMEQVANPNARVVQATKENQNLTSSVNSQAQSPTIINKTVNNNVGSGSSGSSNGGVRNDESVLQKIQYQNMRPV